jgi:hypothetical protein
MTHPVLETGGGILGSGRQPNSCASYHSVPKKMFTRHAPEGIVMAKELVGTKKLNPGWRF